ncbi:MAG: hypothetical protein R3F43_15190 [bacterium]
MRRPLLCCLLLLWACDSSDDPRPEDAAVGPLDARVVQPLRISVSPRCPRPAPGTPPALRGGVPTTAPGGPGVCPSARRGRWRPSWLGSSAGRGG